MIKRPFEQWLFEDVELTFGIDRTNDIEDFTKWLEIQQETEKLDADLEALRQLLSDNVETLNEDELKMLFIAPFLMKFDFHHPPIYRVFTQRLMRLQTDTVESSGRVEWMIATGKQTPRQPFFFLQEYKPEKGANNDPLGQLLIAMVDAQSRNESIEKPIYGCYTIGRLWFFVLLKGKEYGLSRAYDATQLDDMSDMVVILKRVETHIKTELGLL